MRYFEIVRPSAGHISTYTDAIEAAPREPLESGIWIPSNANRPALVSNSLINRPSRRLHLSPRRSQ